jgi:hypothetical protein
MVITDPIPKRIADFVESEIPGCSFVGISSDKEVFVSFDPEGDSSESDATKKIADHFGPEISSVAVIVSVSLEEVTRLVDGLNQSLEKEISKKPELLNIGRF